MTPTALLILTYVCDYAAELDAEALADLAIPRPRLTSPAAYLAWRSGVAAHS